jgi:threonine dehydrogenase-like Zn-dependent dehydrogenase
LGTLGLGAVAVGPLFGGRVVAIGNDPYRLQLAQRMGAHQSLLYNDPDLANKLDEFTAGAGTDLVVLTANPWPAYRTAVEIVRPNGRVSIVSLLGRGEGQLDFNPLAMQYFYAKGISLIAVSGPAGYLYPNGTSQAFCMDDRYAADREAEHMLSLMADGRLAPSRLITHHFHYSRIAEAYEMAYRREKSMLGVIFHWQD